MDIMYIMTQADHYNDVIMGTMASQITSLTIVYWTVCSGVDQRKHRSSALLAFVRGIHRWPVSSSHKWPVTPKMFPCDDVIIFAQSKLVFSIYDRARSRPMREDVTYVISFLNDRQLAQPCIEDVWGSFLYHHSYVRLNHQSISMGNNNRRPCI